MLKQIRDFFQTEFGSDEDNPSGCMGEAQRRLACAALLIEVAIVDNEFDGAELATMKHILNTQFDIPENELDALIALAHSECSEATSMYQFTQLINQHCGQDEKYELVTGMWRVAFTDGDLDKYEEYIIRKVSDLIHLAHSDFIRAKHTARQQTPIA